MVIECLVFFSPARLTSDYTRRRLLPFWMKVRFLSNRLRIRFARTLTLDPLASASIGVQLRREGPERRDVGRCRIRSPTDFTCYGCVPR